MRASFSIIIRIVFLFAFGAFLSASVGHIAVFFHNFEPADSTWAGSYALAVSIDVTALVLTIGVMFFRKNMPWYALVFVWFFIIALTAFSWFVNWEYAMRFQSNDLTSDATLRLINPILASSFAFLNLSYSLVSEFFSAKVQTPADLQAEAERLEGLALVQKRLDIARESFAKPSLIQRTKGVIKEVQEAANELRNDGHIEEEIIENEAPNQSLKRDDLGMIEGAMYDQIIKDKSLLIELLNEADMMPISDLTLSLQSRFGAYAKYINESRVCVVFDAIKGDYPDLISSANEDGYEADMEPDTDPEQDAISPAHSDENETQIQDDLSPISSANETRITGKLVPDMSDILGANEGQIGGKRGAYAITKEAAAEILRCPISEIERGISSGIIKTFVKDESKVLRTSLGGFVPVKRTRKTAQIAGK